MINTWWLFDVTWVIAVISFTGSILNAKRIRAGFYFLLLSGLLDMILFFQQGWYGKVVHTVLKCGISIYGLINWGKNKNEVHDK